MKKSLVILLLCISSVVLFGNCILFSYIFGWTSSIVPDQGVFVFFAVICDVILVFLLIRWIIKKSIKASEEKNKKRTDEINSKIAAIESRYYPEVLPSTVERADSKIGIERRYINTEVNRIVKEYKKSISKIVNDCFKINLAIKNILSFDAPPAEKLKYLSGKTEELTVLKQQSDLRYAKIEKTKIVLLNEDEETIKSLQLAFLKLIKSEKCQSTVIPIRVLVSLRHPTELKMFSYKNDPLVMSFKDFDYCFFSNVILVFDSRGVYVTALDPSALRLSVTRETEKVYISKTCSPNRNNTGNDSQTVNTGTTVSTWAHITRSGLPDMRYSFNPRIEYHIDDVMFGRVEFWLSEKIEYTFSSYQAILSLEDAEKKYVKKSIGMKETIPDLLDLIKRSDPDDRMIDGIIKDCKSSEKSYFCQIS